MKIKLLSALILSVTVAAFGFVAAANAQSFRSGTSPTIRSDEVVDGSAYLAGTTIDVAGSVDGDLFCAGQEVTISGDIDGDILCAAQTIHFTGTASGDLRLTAQMVTIGGSVGGSASIASQTVTIEGGGSVGKDATFASQKTSIKGQVSRDLVVASDSFILDARVGRNVTADANDIKLEAGTDVAGTFTYTSPELFTEADDAIISGEVNYTERDRNNSPASNVYNPLWMILWALMLIASAIIFALLFPRVLFKVSRVSVGSPSKAFVALLVGFVAVVAIPFIAFIFMATIVGIPFAILVLLAWSLIVAVSGVFAAYYVGRLVWRNPSNNIILATFVGALIIVLLLMIPFVNIFIMILCVSYGSGVLLMYLRNHFEQPKYDIPVERSRSNAA